MSKRTDFRNQQTETAEMALLSLGQLGSECRAAGLELLAHLIGAAALQAGEDFLDVSSDATGSSDCVDEPSDPARRMHGSNMLFGAVAPELEKRTVALL